MASFDDGWDPDQAAANLSQELAFDPSESSVDIAARLLRENLPGAVSVVVHSAVHGSTEKTRLDAAKYIIDRNLGRITEQPLRGDSDVDPLRAFLGTFIKEVEDVANGKVK